MKHKIDNNIKLFKQLCLLSHELYLILNIYNYYNTCINVMIIVKL